MEFSNVNKDGFNPYIPKNGKKNQQRPLDEKLRSDLEWQSWNWKVNWSEASPSSSTDWWQSGKWHEPQQGEWQDEQWSDECKYSLSLILQPFLQESCTFVGFVFSISRTDISECRARDGCVKTAHLVVRTERVAQTHIFSRAHVIIAHALSQDLTFVSARSSKVTHSSHVSWHIVRATGLFALSVLIIPAQASLLTTGKSQNPCVTPQGGLILGLIG